MLQLHCLHSRPLVQSCRLKQLLLTFSRWGPCGIFRTLHAVWQYRETWLRPTCTFSGVPLSHAASDIVHAQSNFPCIKVVLATWCRHGCCQLC